MQSPRISVHMVASLDGYIAKRDNSIGWFEAGHDFPAGKAFGDPTEFLKTIDAYVMGSKTYELALELSKEHGWAYGDTPTIVLSHRNLPIERDSVAIFSGDIGALVQERLSAYQNVWVVGGPEVVKAFLQEGRVNEIRMTILPILLGDGLPFFDAIGIEQPLQLLEATPYVNGMVELVYAVGVPT